MKIIDKYIVKNFMIGYLISLMVLVGLRVVIDLFVNLDEFAERADMGTVGVLANICTFYGVRIALYFREFAGIITVVAAVFSLGKMTKNNELIAYEYLEKYKSISPCLLLHFNSEPKTRPIREHRFEEYEKLLKIY